MDDFMAAVWIVAKVVTALALFTTAIVRVLETVNQHAGSGWAFYYFASGVAGLIVAARVLWKGIQHG